MKFFTGKQIKDWDAYTVQHESIRSIDLMERAANGITEIITQRWDKNWAVVVFAGPGNNGGDALAVARMLTVQGYKVETYLFNTKGSLSEDCTTNRNRLVETIGEHKFVEVKSEFDPPKITEQTLVIDGLFGSGLSRPLMGGYASLVKYINNAHAQVLSIDLPSGMMTEDNSFNLQQSIIRATLTVTIQQMKICMLMPENAQNFGEIMVLDIGLSEEYARRTNSRFMFTESKMIRSILRPRSPFAHKGSMGHALLIAGSKGMAGAASMAAQACLRSGLGKLTMHVPLCNVDIHQISVPEAVIQFDKDNFIFSEAVDIDDFDSVGIGPGLGQDENTAIAMMSQIRRTQCPMVLDADALNMLANHQPWMEQLPEGLILTPHPAEFDRLNASHSDNSFQRLTKAREMAVKLNAFIILKSHFSALCSPDGDVYFCSTGNAGMATAGSGDVLTGIITGLLARGYNQLEACLIGMHAHGLAGDIAANEIGEEGLIATDIIKYLPRAMKRLYQG